jgi:hypothetical protein
MLFDQNRQFGQHQIPKACGGVFSLARWPNSPPLPPGIWSLYPDLQFQYSVSMGMAFMDDRPLYAAQALVDSLNPLLPPSGTNDYGSDYSTHNPSPLYPQPDYSTNTTDLWLSLPWATNGPSGQVCILLHNTTNLLYALRGHPAIGDGVSCTNWDLECLVFGNSETNVLSAIVPMGDRTNTLFFWAEALPATNLAAVATLTSVSSCLASVNAEPATQRSPFYGTLVGFASPIHSLNLGYGAYDWCGSLYWGIQAKISNHWADPNQLTREPLFGAQNAVELAFSGEALTTLTNLLLSGQTKWTGNPITRLNLAGATAITDIECFGCTNLASVSLTNCPNLRRACVEGCAIQGVLDFNGDTNLVDIRGSFNQLTDIRLGDAAQTLKHFCVHDNPFTNIFSFSNSGASERQCYGSGAAAVRHYYGILGLLGRGLEGIRGPIGALRGRLGGWRMAKDRGQKGPGFAKAARSVTVALHRACEVGGRGPVVK